MEDRYLRIPTSITVEEITDENEDDGGQDIPEEEVVCRICFEELGEGSESLKLECSYKGELALVHQECTVKWFSIKGNKICEVCKEESMEKMNPNPKMSLKSEAQDIKELGDQWASNSM